MWSWDDYYCQRSAFLCLTNSSNDDDNTNNSSDNKENEQQSKLSNPNILESMVKLIARILAFVEAGPDEFNSCLECFHGPPHNHKLFKNSIGKSTEPIQTHCLVAKLGQAALNTGLSCPNRHYASRSLQIYRALGVHLDTKLLPNLLARICETISDGKDEMQVYVMELFLTQEALIHHLQTKSNSLIDYSTIARNLTDSNDSGLPSGSSSGRQKSHGMVGSISDRRNLHYSKLGLSSSGGRYSNLGVWSALNESYSKSVHSSNNELKQSCSLVSIDETAPW